MMSLEITEKLLEKVSAKFLCVIKGKSESDNKEDENKGR